ncbi:hypothetical protein LF1_37080 [Rubripirellula obstinata]|uniref:Uncharacterized protein n=1 Tax=Rubripirellula obstinata TaxID=406547 RepID=A0A5B1CP68_9BACT|nr:hypothetical protein [Rubripirellula obstinata]KAA1261163.1 hypothetical protein LF1_37080 [Rubripirellula obstinata]
MKTTLIMLTFALGLALAGCNDSVYDEQADAVRNRADAIADNVEERGDAIEERSETLADEIEDAGERRADQLEAMDDHGVVNEVK